LSLNWKEINQILAELPLAGCHIQKIRQPDFQTLLLDLHRPGNSFTLLFSLAPGRLRFHQTQDPPASQIGLQRFAQFLRARISGGRISEAFQEGSDRLAALQIRRGEEETWLCFRLWGGSANILALDAQGLILDAFYRRPRRGEVSGGPFPLPRRDSLPGPGAEKYQSRFLPGGDSVHRQVERLYRRLEEQEELVRLTARVERLLADREAGINRGFALCREREAQALDPGEYKRIGDLLMANLGEIKKGDRWAEVDNFYDPGQRLKIELNPEAGPVENAQGYYKRAARSRAAGERARQERENLERELKILEEEKKAVLLPAQALLAASPGAPDREADPIPPEIILSLKEYLALHHRRTPDKTRDRGEGPPGLNFTLGDRRLLVGRNARENDELLRRHVRGSDYWLHTRDFSGAYVFIKAVPGKPPPLELLLDAGNLALFFSQGRRNGRGELYYTQVKYLRRAKDGPPGLVLPTQEKNLFIVLDQKRLDRIMKN
jgi:predicted ribosome quality control (RQC) complex YloA/Tae2 family protein